MSSAHSPLDLSFQRLREVRAVLLRLHKVLLNSERDVYEQFHGRIQSNGQFFQLVLEDDWFSWLRPFSQFIVQIDEALSAKEPITLDRANELLDEVRSLVSPAEEGTNREQRYFQAIQRDPDIALLHAEVSRLLATEALLNTRMNRPPSPPNLGGTGSQSPPDLGDLGGETEL